jgi:hypothetical protein
MPNPAATYNIGGSRVEEVMFWPATVVKIW